MKKFLVYLFSFSLLLLNGGGLVYAGEDEFTPAYQNIDSYEVADPKDYMAYEGDRAFYTSGKKNGFRVNENNTESTDETIGIITLIVAPFTIVYMNVIDWWN